MNHFLLDKITPLLPVVSNKQLYSTHCKHVRRLSVKNVCCQLKVACVAGARLDRAGMSQTSARAKSVTRGKSGESSFTLACLLSCESSLLRVFSLACLLSCVSSLLRVFSLACLLSCGSSLLRVFSLIHVLAEHLLHRLNLQLTMYE